MRRLGVIHLSVSRLGVIHLGVIRLGVIHLGVSRLGVIHLAVSCALPSQLLHYYLLFYFTPLLLSPPLSNATGEYYVSTM